MMNLLLGCSLDSDLFLDPHCSSMRDYNKLSQQDRDSFWSVIADHPRDSYVTHFILKPFECKSTEMMSTIYRMYCGMVKEDHMSLFLFAIQPSVGKRIGKC